MRPERVAEHYNSTHTNTVCLITSQCYTNSDLSVRGMIMFLLRLTLRVFLPTVVVVCALSVYNHGTRETRVRRSLFWRQHSARPSPPMRIAIVSAGAEARHDFLTIPVKTCFIQASTERTQTSRTPRFFLVVQILAIRLG